MLGSSICIILCCKSRRAKRVGRTAQHTLDWMCCDQIWAELPPWQVHSHHTQVSELAKLISTTYASLKIWQAGLLKSWCNCRPSTRVVSELSVPIMWRFFFWFYCWTWLQRDWWSLWGRDVRLSYAQWFDLTFLKLRISRELTHVAFRNVQSNN